MLTSQPGFIFSLGSKIASYSGLADWTYLESVMVLSLDTECLTSLYLMLLSLTLCLQQIDSVSIECIATIIVILQHTYVAYDVQQRIHLSLQRSSIQLQQ